MTTGGRVSRHLVHRAHDREVLVSPPRRAADGGYVSSTVTTDLSAYYTDHPPTHPVDLVLLTEACRQAALSAAHRFEGIPMDITYFVNTLEVRIGTAGALSCERPETVITTRIDRMRLRGNGAPKQITCAQTARFGPGATTLHAVMTVQGVPKDRYSELRAYQRAGSAPPTTADLRHRRRPGGVTEPAAVARTQPVNVVLADLHIEGASSTATLAPDLTNHGLFDHDYDHIPALVLIEAGRQLALAGTRNPYGWMATGVRAEFLHFAELDRAAVLTAHRQGDRVRTVCAQDGSAITRMVFEMEPVGGAA